MVLTTIRLSRPGLSPPVYLAGTFTQWEPTIEMDHDAVFGSRDQHEFSKTVDIQAGEHQFKFRLGHGDWWIVDDLTPTVPDGFGNVNNVIHVFEATETETKIVEVNEQSLPVKEVTSPSKVPVEEDKSTREAPITEQTPAPEVPVKGDKAFPEIPSIEDTPAPTSRVPVEEPKSTQKDATKEVKPAQEVLVAESKPAPEVSSKEEKSVPKVPTTNDTPAPKVSVNGFKSTPEVPEKETKSIPDVPIKEDKPPRKVTSKDTFASIKTTTSELTAVVNQEISSVQSILRDSDNDSVASPGEEPQTRNQKAQTQSGEVDGISKNRATETEERKPAKISSNSFIKRLFSCFSGKTAFGLATVSAVMVAVYIRR